MNKIKIFLITLTILLCCIYFIPKNAIGAVGDTYSQTLAEYGNPESKMTISDMAGNNTAEQRYIESNGISAYNFNVPEKILNFKTNILIHAYFNSKNICYKITSSGNRLIPSSAVFVGSLANEKPIVISTSPDLVLQYGSGTNEVILTISGISGDFNAVAYSPSLTP